MMQSYSDSCAIYVRTGSTIVPLRAVLCYPGYTVQYAGCTVVVVRVPTAPSGTRGYVESERSLFRFLCLSSLMANDTNEGSAYPYQVPTEKMHAFYYVQQPIIPSINASHTCRAIEETKSLKKKSIPKAIQN